MGSLISKIMLIGIGLGIVVGAYFGIGACEKEKNPIRKSHTLSTEIPGLCPTGVLHDLDGDYLVDLITCIGRGTGSRTTYFVAPGYENHCIFGPWTSTMTPEIRDASSKMLQGGQDLGKAITTFRYESKNRKGK